MQSYFLMSAYNGPLYRAMNSVDLQKDYRIKQ